MKINVIYNTAIANYENVLEFIKDALGKRTIDFYCYDLNNMGTFGEFSIVIGGDGTLLKAARFYSNYSIPVLGLNLGRLGFLAQANVEDIDKVVDAILNKEFHIEERLMLESSSYLALNDFVIKGCNQTRTSKFYLEINEKFVCDYIADGLIISTPTGSTAYGLSAGGPIIYPTMSVITVVPICPHTLNARPLVIPITEKITVKTSDKLLSVAIDGFDTTNCVEKITIKSAEQKSKLVFLNNQSFYNVLRNKLHWGVSPTD